MGCHRRTALTDLVADDVVAVYVAVAEAAVDSDLDSAVEPVHAG